MPTLGQHVQLHNDTVDAVIVAGRQPVVLQHLNLPDLVPHLVSTITSEIARRVPDISVAETVRRLPGISLQTEVGEGSYVNIRGINADLNGLLRSDTGLFAGFIGNARVISYRNVAHAYSRGVELIFRKNFRRCQHCSMASASA